MGKTVENMKAGKNTYRTFKVDCGTYDFSINFVVTSDLSKACRYLNFKLELSKTDGQIKPEHLDALGKTAITVGYCPIIWLPNFPVTPKEYGTLYHEIFHAVCDCMRWAEIPLTESSEEAYSHLIGHVTKGFFSKYQNQ